MRAEFRRMMLIVLCAAIVATGPVFAAPRAKELCGQAWAAKETGDLGVALDLFDQAVQAQPKYAEAWFGLGYVRNALGQQDGALEAYQQAIRFQSRYTDAYVNIAPIYDELGRYPEAEKASKRAIELEPNAPDAYANLASTYLKMERYEDAEIQSRRAIKLQPDHPMANFWLGEALTGLKRYDEAARYYRTVIELSTPMRFLAYDRLGKCLFEVGRFEDALDAYSGAVRLEPALPLNHYNRGLVLTRLERHKEAAEAFATAAELDPKSHDSLIEMGASLVNAGEYERAVDSFLKAIQVIEAEKSEMRLYRRQYNEYWRLDEAYLRLGYVCGYLGRYGQAVEALWKASQASTDSKTRVECYTLIVEMTERVITEYPGEGYLYYNLGLGQRRLGRYQEAIASLKRAVELDPGHPYVYMELGECYGALLEYTKETEVYLKWVSREPENPEAHHALAFAYLGTDDMEAAQREYEILLKLDPAAAEHVLHGMGKR